MPHDEEAGERVAVLPYNVTISKCSSSPPQGVLRFEIDSPPSTGVLIVVGWSSRQVGACLPADDKGGNRVVESISMGGSTFDFLPSILRPSPHNVAIIALLNEGHASYSIDVDATSGGSSRLSAGSLHLIQGYWRKPEHSQ